MIEQKALYKAIRNTLIYEFEERFEPIAGFDDMFVSNYGYIVSERRKKPIIRKAQLKKGFPFITVTGSHGSKRGILIHRAVADAFLTKPIFPKAHIVHKDSDKTNNRFDNLEWVYDSVPLSMIIPSWVGTMAPKGLGENL